MNIVAKYFLPLLIMVISVVALIVILLIRDKILEKLGTISLKVYRFGYKDEVIDYYDLCLITDRITKNIKFLNVITLAFSCGISILICIASFDFFNLSDIFVLFLCYFILFVIDSLCSSDLADHYLNQPVIKTEFENMNTDILCNDKIEFLKRNLSVDEMKEIAEEYAYLTRSKIVHNQKQ